MTARTSRWASLLAQAGRHASRGDVAATQRCVNEAAQLGAVPKPTLVRLDRWLVAARRTKAKRNPTKRRRHAKRRANNPWAICGASVGRRRKRKFERCVRHVKGRVRRLRIKPARNPAGCDVKLGKVRYFKVHGIHRGKLPSGASAYIGYIKDKGKRRNVASMDNSPGSWFSFGY